MQPRLVSTTKPGALVEVTTTSAVTSSAGISASPTARDSTRRRKVFSVGSGPVRYSSDQAAARAEVARRQLAHLAGSDEQDGAAVEVVEYLLCESRRSGRDGGRAFADRRLDAGAPTGMERLPEEVIEKGARRATLEGVAHLAQDLTLSRHEGVEPCGDAKQVQGGAVVSEAVENGGERGAVGAGERQQRGARPLVQIAAFAVTREVQLRPVAGRENHGLAPIRELEREGRRAGWRRLRRAPSIRRVPGDARRRRAAELS